MRQPTSRKTEKNIQKEVRLGQTVDTSNMTDALEAKKIFNPQVRSKKKTAKKAAPTASIVAVKKAKGHRKHKRTTPKEKIAATAAPASAHKEGIRWINTLSRQIRETVRNFKMKINKRSTPRKAKKR